MSGKNPLPHELAYQGVKAVNPPDVIVSKRNPNVTDTKYPIGTFWINTETNQSYQLLDAPGVWILMSPAAAAGVLTLTGNSGGVASPTAGNINIRGQNNTTVVRAGSTLTVTGDLNPFFQDVNAASVDTSGDIMASGDIVGSSNLTVTSSIYLRGVGSKFRVRGGGALDSVGLGTLVAGTATIANTSLDSGEDRILVQRTALNGSTALGELTCTIISNTSFTVRSAIPATPGSTEAGDLSSFVYFIVRQG